MALAGGTPTRQQSLLSLPHASLRWLLGRADAAQLVPRTRLRRRYLLLLRGHDLCGRRHPRTQREDLAALLRAAGGQLHLLGAATLPPSAVPAPPHARLRRHHRPPRAE